MISEELILIACVWRWEKKKIKTSYVYWRVVKVCLGSIQYGGIKKFCYECVSSILLGYFGIFRIIRIFLVKNCA